MATGDIKVTVQIEGGDAKTATIPSATRVNALAWMNRDRGTDDNPDLTDATYSVHIANSAANAIAHAAKKQITVEPSTPTFTAAE